MVQYAPTFQSSSTSSAPWAPAMPGLTQALAGARKAYDTTYQGPQIAEMDPNLVAGQERMLGTAGAGQTSAAAGAGIGQLQDLLGAGGIGAPMQYGMESLRDVQGYLTPYASGEMLGQNPYLDEVLRRSMADAADATNAQFSSAGRYGSGAHAGALGTRLGGIEADARMQDYWRQQQNQLGATGQLSNIAGQYAGIGQQGIGNTFGASSALGQYDPLLSADAQLQKGVGAERTAYEQLKIDAANEAPWTRVGNLSQIASGIGGLGGTSNTSSFGLAPQPPSTKPSTGQMIGGGVVAGAGLLGNAFGGPLGGLAAGGTAAGLMSLFSGR